ncbi:MAG: hypothetical protein KAS39_08285 [Actinomycetia bacterium]|nr:hypothetical protein [Actinomycetes bacterium]
MEEITKEEIGIIEKESFTLFTQAEMYDIQTVEDVDNASLFLSQIKKMEKTTEAKRLTFTKPINESLKAINSTFKELTEPLKEAVGVVTGKILTWKKNENARIAKEAKEARAKADAERREAEKKRRKAEEARREAEIEGYPDPEPEPKPEPLKPVIIPKAIENKIGNIQGRKVWTYAIVDITKVPEEFMIVDDLNVKRSIRAGERNIPGLRIYQDEKLSIVGR